MSEKHFAAKIADRQEVAEDLFVLRVEPGGPFSYLAGQYATLGVEVEGKRLERAYSLCSSPYEDVLEFFVERVHGGELSPLLHAMDKGAPLLLRKYAKGRFTLDLRSGRKNHLLLSTVTGVAPYVSYVRTVYADWKKGGTPMPGEHRLFCVQGASRSAEFGYREELEKCAAEASWLKYVTTVSRPWEDLEWKGELGRVDDLIRKYVDLWRLQPAETTAYLCGHPNMVSNGRGILLRAGWEKTAIQDEVYFQPGKEKETVVEG
jgi:ferredoxin--NADP+ reductase